MKIRWLVIVGLGIVGLVAAGARAQGPIQRLGYRIVANNRPWHYGYYDPAWGQPHALVVPPTAENQVKYSWGVTGTTVTPIYHQFRRPYPGAWFGGPGILPAPAQPASTDQFGVYYVRGPW
ncbi:MAG TPA: hypothetical protein VHZ24_13805 [Pirellulales bacterium]|jgi:hypothetical protein|nr:hypothetical protein [Pirellulales bacterium]